MKSRLIAVPTSLETPSILVDNLPRGRLSMEQIVTGRLQLLKQVVKKASQQEIAEANRLIAEIDPAWFDQEIGWAIHPIIDPKNERVMISVLGDFERMRPTAQRLLETSQKALKWEESQSSINLIDWTNQYLAID